MSMELLLEELPIQDMTEGFQRLFEEREDSFASLLQMILAGDVKEALKILFRGIGQGVLGGIPDVYEAFVWILMIGILSVVLSQMISVFDKHQVADLCFYVFLFLLIAVLSKCYLYMFTVVQNALEKTVLFIQLMIPPYLVAVGMTSGQVTVQTSYQVMLLVIWVIETILKAFILPGITISVLLNYVNSLWQEERFRFCISFLEKGLQWAMKGMLGLICGVSMLQAMLSPLLDEMKTQVVKKTASMIPGIGQGVEGVWELVMESAVVIKNGIGILLLILLVVLCALPILHVLIMVMMLKLAAAILGIVADKRIVQCIHQLSCAGELLLKGITTANALFFVFLAILILSTGRNL